MSLSVGNPTAAVIRRTCLFLPSVKVNSNHVSGTVLRTRMGGTRSGHAGEMTLTFAPRVRNSLPLILKGKGGTQPLQLFVRGHAFHLHMVRAFMPTLGVQELGLEAVVVGQEQKPFAVRIEPTHGVDVFAPRQLKRPQTLLVAFVRELTQKPEGFVQHVQLQVTHAAKVGITRPNPRRKGWCCVFFRCSGWS